ncbi:MAG: mechanosensitive ion channel [Bacteroides sp.]|nr:mechanosensitive ion channel [Bacteroides sp.]
MSLFTEVTQKTDSIATTAKESILSKSINIVDGINPDEIKNLLDRLVEWSITASGRILSAIIIFIVGRLVISLIKRFLIKIMEKRNVDLGVRTFVSSLVNILLIVVLCIAVVSKLGVETTSFAALLASAGVAIGMALSGNLQNFAGGLVILLLKPYKVGDFIENQNFLGTVTEIQIFHTILKTPDNKMIYIPNGTLNSGVLVNYNRQTTRRIEWVVGVEYGEDYDKVRRVLKSIIDSEKRIVQDPLPIIELNALAASSVNIVVRCWVNTEDYWDVYFKINQEVYKTFNKEGIGFPFPQLTVHNAQK